MRRIRFGAWIATVAAIGVAAAPAHAQEPVDLLLHNGKVFTADALLSTYSAVAVRDGRIVALGWDDLADRYRAARTIDLDGRLVVPGFIDTHIHIRGNPERWVDLSGLESLGELKARGNPEGGADRGGRVDHRLRLVRGRAGGAAPAVPLGSG